MARSTEAIETAYEQRKKRYTDQGRNEVYLNGLRKARLFFRKGGTAPVQIRKGLWFVASASNDKRTAAGDPPIGYECRPYLQKCACQNGAFVRYPTCVHQEVVGLHLESLRVPGNEREQPIPAAREQAHADPVDALR
jgi:hypothetical protein